VVLTTFLISLVLGQDGWDDVPTETADAESTGTDCQAAENAPPAPEPQVFPPECRDLPYLIAALNAGDFLPSCTQRWARVRGLRWEPTPPTHSAADGQDRCDLERIAASELSPQRFRADYLEKKPVIIVNATNWTSFAQMTAKHVLLYCYGDFDVTLSTANKNSYNKFETSFRHYVAEHLQPQKLEASGVGTKYFFGDNKHAEWEDVFRYYVQPSQYIWSYASLSFGIGGSGSGVPFHTHGHVFAEVLHGRKRWFLQAPGPEPRFDPDASSLRWIVHVEPALSPEEKSKILDCTCAPGDTIYIPTHWHHSTLNLGEAVFMSTFV
jgi:hypothetical protein